MARTWLFVLLLTAAAAAEVKVESGYVTAHDGARLYYEKLGSGPQKVIVPGGMFLRPDLDALATSERTVIFYHMRNRGASSRVEDEKAITIENDVRDLETIRQHFGFEKFSPIGYSYLGMMVVLYAKDHPERVERLVQLGPVPLDYRTEFPEHLRNADGEKVVDQELLKEVRQWREQGWDKTRPKEFCEKQSRLMARVLVGKPESAAKVQNNCRHENEWPVNFGRHLQAHFVGSVQKLHVPREEVAAKVKHPVLTIHGTLDRNAPYGAGRDWQLILPNARLITVEGGAHQVFADEPRVVEWTSEFLAGKWPEKAQKVTKLDTK